MDTHAYAPLPRAELVPSRQLRQWNALWSWLAGSVRHESSLIPSISMLSCRPMALFRMLPG